MISVIMGTKCSEYRLNSLKRSVDSILNQTYKDFEFIICDNGSCDKALIWLDSKAKEDARVRLHRPLGIDTLQKKLNECIKISNGNFIARMDDDDVSNLNRFELQLQFLMNNREVNFVGSNILEVSVDGISVPRKLPKFPTINDFKFTQPYIHPTLIFRKEVFEDVGLYSESNWKESCEDYDLLLRIYEFGMIGANIQETLLEYSIYNSQEKKKRYKYRINEFLVRVKHFYKLKKLHLWFLYALKPLIVGIIPLNFLVKLRKRYRSKGFFL